MRQSRMKVPCYCTNGYPRGKKNVALLKHGSIWRKLPQFKAFSIYFGWKSHENSDKPHGWLGNSHVAHVSMGTSLIWGLATILHLSQFHKLRWNGTWNGTNPLFFLFFFLKVPIRCQCCLIPAFLLINPPHDCGFLMVPTPHRWNKLIRCCQASSCWLYKLYLVLYMFVHIWIFI